MRALGKPGYDALRFLLMLAHLQFSIGQLSFTLQSLSSTFTVWCGKTEEISYWYFAIGIVLLYSPIAWVRCLEVFSVGFMFSMGMIALAVLTTTVYAF